MSPGRSASPRIEHLLAPPSPSTYSHAAAQHVTTCSRRSRLSDPDKVRVLPEGLGRTVIELLRWFRDEVGEGNFARQETETLEEALAIHFRRPEDLSRFLASFPRLELADETRSRGYAFHHPLPKLRS